MHEKIVEIWTDGAAKGNPGPGGYGVVLSYKDKKGEVHRKELCDAFLDTTNNKMEVLAAIVALKELKEPCTVRLTSDSKYLVDAFNKGWVTSWQKENFRIGKKDEVKNIDLWKELISLTNIHKVTFSWVKGHAENEENNRCDTLANIAIKKLLEGKDVNV